ncbi:MAG: metalloregulator ArsR/SmtB family transcription factor [Candidatus Aminicenantes bacterium]|nr:metalloregulator ArsR/SmtB family transcription factor [Candidatus Aminicenantes bacterium]MDH5741913.1 metalloregulator ArsR/SmtB family transcription factor [Candidatus Aminicenantes bacterium]
MKQTVKIFKSLSDPTRLRILFLLLQRELCVCELTYILEMEQSRISHQLRVLRNADLVEDIRDGKWIVYRISEKKKKDLKLIFDRIIGKDLANSEEMTKEKAKLQASQKNSIRNCPASFEGRDV